MGSEIVGLVPRQALDDAAVHFLRVENFRPELIVENRLEQVLEGLETRNLETRNSNGRANRQSTIGNRQYRKAPLRAMVEEFVNAVAAPTPTPGAAASAALAGALAAGLGEMVCGVSLKRKSLAPIIRRWKPRAHAWPHCASG